MSFYSEQIFPRFFDLVVDHKPFDKYRSAVLEQVEGPVLEIGIGTGINLEFYPKKIRKISAVDPSAGMERQLKAKLERRKNLKVDFHRVGAENLPFKTGQFKTVVSTLSLCSIPELQQALSEVRRVLAPGGKFIFLDHGLSHDAKVARWQRILNPLQQRIGCGCKLTIDVKKELLDAGFRLHDLKNYYVPKVA